MAIRSLMKELTCASPAKINLFLHILGRRADGYHNLQTVFQFLDYCDELVFQVRDDKYITLESSIENLAIENNLVYRAAILLQKVTGTARGADIRLRKKIPLGGGLGGGSSNAATTLVALNRLWQTGLNDIALAELGLQLGADVPVFIYGKAAFGEGIGERLTPVPLKEPWYVVVIPPCSVTTAEIFSDMELTRNTPAITIQQFLDGKLRLQNDCEPIVRKKYPEVAAALDWLNAFACAKLTGTGSCVFAEVNNNAQAQAVLQKLPASLQGFSAKGLNISPLYNGV